MLLLVAFQVLVLNHLQLFGYGTPLIFVVLLLYMPMGTMKASGAMTFAAMIQPSVLKLLAPRDAAEDITPTMQTLGRWNYIRYMMIIYLIHHLVYFGLECFSLYHMTDAVLLMAASWASSILMALLLESFRKKK